MSPHIVKVFHIASTKFMASVWCLGV